MTLLRQEVEKMKQYYIQKLLDTNVFKASEKDPSSYTLKELETMWKQIHRP